MLCFYQPLLEEPSHSDRVEIVVRVEISDIAKYPEPIAGPLLLP